MACRRSGVRIPLAPPGQRPIRIPASQAGSQCGSQVLLSRHEQAWIWRRRHLLRPFWRLPRRAPPQGRPGRWRGAVSLGYGSDGKRIRRKVGGHTKQEVKDKLEELHADLNIGTLAPDGRSSRPGDRGLAADVLDGRAEKTVTLNRGALNPSSILVGTKPLRELTARMSVRELATSRPRVDRTIVVAHNAIERAIRHAEANDTSGECRFPGPAAIGAPDDRLSRSRSIRP